MSDVREIIVVFKTHFDLGYTDFAENVWEKYKTSYIPAALDRTSELRGAEDRFVWTTGSWLIHTFLNEAEPAARLRMEEAIAQGDITWHGLPVTTHTELMDSGLMEYGLSIAQGLDRRFGKTTIAAKLTDVPGHTRAMIPYLARAGIEFLHVGVNPVSVSPSVPPLFTWRAPDGSELTVMYTFGYGEYQEIGDTGVALMFAHTGDNNGPPPKEEIRRMFAELRSKYPQAVIRTGDLNDVAVAARALRGRLPVVTAEIGDSWIHGAASDPGKISMFRAMLRLREDWPAAEQSEVNSHLLLIPEHTWGLDYKSNAKDHVHYDADGFARVLHTPPFERLARSWDEQRGYLRDAADALPESYAREARRAMAEYRCERLDTANGSLLQPGERVCFHGNEIALDDTGAIAHLTVGGQLLADAEHRLGVFRYEAFSRHETDRFCDQYMDCSKFPSLEPLARDDFNKLGAERAIDYRCQTGAALTELVLLGDCIVAKLCVTDPRLVEAYGCPAELMLRIHLRADGIGLDFAWWNKRPTRVPEGVWLGFQPVIPASTPAYVRKLSAWIDAADVISHGGRKLHATDWGVALGSSRVESLDCAVVNIGPPSLWNFDDVIPDPAEGCWFCLSNNMWNTNFPLWYGENARFRFHITVDGAPV